MVGVVITRSAIQQLRRGFVFLVMLRGCGPGNDNTRDRWRVWGGSDGEGGIRTLGNLAATPVFETGPIDHSGTSPGTPILRAGPITDNSRGHSLANAA